VNSSPITPSRTTSSIGVIPIRNGVVALHGYGLSISVDRQHLRVKNGIGAQRREGRFAKAPSRLKRLLVIAQTGFVTFDALRWLNDVGAAFVQLDYDASILAATIGALDDARLRRAQALIVSTEHATVITKGLLVAKIRGQLAAANSFGLAGDPSTLRAAEDGDDVSALLRAEAKCAEAYWEAWAPVSMEFARRDRPPDHWRVFGNRRSVLTLGPRNAANPLNAILNFLYALLETETRLALIGRGLDTGLGIFHADTANRQSLAADVMEPVRPHVDAFVLNLARTRTFSAKDFCETREGGCRLSSALTHELAATMPTWGKLVAPHAELVARQITELARKGFRVSRPSAMAERGRVKVRVRPIETAANPRKGTLPISAVRNACRDCGEPITVRKRVYCDVCLPLRREEIQNSNKDAFTSAGPAKINAMRKAGHDPTNSKEAKLRRSTTASKQRRAAATWIDDGSLATIDFVRDIAPKLAKLPVKTIAEAMESSISHGSKVRGGLLIPHRRHWRSLLVLGNLKSSK